MLSLIINLLIVISLVWPILCALAIACFSEQSGSNVGSKNIILLEQVRFIPLAELDVDNSITHPDLLFLNVSMDLFF